MHPCALEIVKGGVCPGVRSGGIVVVVEEVVVHRGTCKAFVEVETMVETLTARPRGHALLSARRLRRNGVTLMGGRHNANANAGSAYRVRYHCVRRAVRDS